MLLFSFYPPWKQQVTRGFLTLSGFIWVKVFINEPSKIFGRQPLKYDFKTLKP